jgi:hypothetical protein
VIKVPWLGSLSCFWSERALSSTDKVVHDKVTRAAQESVNATSWWIPVTIGRWDPWWLWGTRQISAYRRMNGRDVLGCQKYTLPQVRSYPLSKPDCPLSKLEWRYHRRYVFGDINWDVLLSLQQRAGCALLAFQWAVNSCCTY